MSVLICEFLPNGIVMSADRYVTVTTREGEADSIGQEQGKKIFRWPHRRALVGAVGLAHIGDKTMSEWMEDFIGDHHDFQDSSSVADDLCQRLQREVPAYEPPEPLIIMFATFSGRHGCMLPECWHITNVPGVDQNGYLPATNEFSASERIGFHLLTEARMLPADIPRFLAERVAAHDPFWFHQGIDLAVFNTLSGGVRAAFRLLHDAGKLNAPETLEDWERHAKMWVLLYGAYFEAFGLPGQRYVGGGADTLSIPWPPG